MRPDHPQIDAVVEAQDQFERGFGKGDFVPRLVDIEVDPEDAIEAGGILGMGWRVPGRDPVRVVEQRDFLLGAVRKADPRVIGA